MSDVQQAPETKFRFPKKTLVFTILVIAVLAVLHWQAFNLIENYQMDPAIPSLLLVLLVPVTVFVWGIWAFFFAKRRLVGMLIFAIPVIFFVLFYPNFRGDIAIAGFTPRFWSRSVDYVQPVTEGPAADLKTTTDIDFPQFLGPNRNLHVDGVSLVATWDREPELLWKMDVGEGWSGFVVVNGFAITQEQRKSEECVTCYEVETGNPVWVYCANRRHEDTMAMGKVGPRATPTINEGLVYVTSGTGVLDCIDGSNGELVWSADVPALVNIRQIELKNSMGLTYTTEDSSLLWGRSTSPLIVDDVVVVPAGGPAVSQDNPDPPAPVTLIAFDKKTGQEKWRGGNRMIAYGSPTLATVAGQRQILLVAEAHAVGHDVETGRELWSHQWPGRSGADANCSQVTVVDDNRLIVSKGYNQGGELIEVTQVDGDWKVKSLKRDPRILKTKLTNPVVYQGHVYTLSSGYLECTEIDSFQRKWIQRGSFGNGQLLLVGDKLLVHAETGELMLISADPSGYSELGSIKTIRGICWNTVCLYGDLILVRSELEAACFRLPTVTP